MEGAPVFEYKDYSKSFNIPGHSLHVGRPKENEPFVLSSSDEEGNLTEILPIYNQEEVEPVIEFLRKTDKVLSIDDLSKLVSDFLLKLHGN